MIRKIILMLLIFGVFVQGVSAWSDTFYVDSALGDTGWGSSNVSPGFSPYISCYITLHDPTGNPEVGCADSATTHLLWLDNDAYSYDNWEGGGSWYQPTSNALKWYISVSGGGRATIYGTVSDTPLSTASGSALGCNGTFFAYINHNSTPFYVSNNTYSFVIADGLDYQIYFNTTDKWHNFTANGTETWNVPCSEECTPPSGTQTEHGRGSESWLDYFGYLWDGVHSDLILSGNGHFQVYVGGELFYNVFAGTHTIPFSSDFDGQDINVYFSNSTIPGTWWNYTNHINEIWS